MGETRTERDTLGTIEVPADCLWGAQTQRSLDHFRISSEKMPQALLHALAHIKRAGAIVNAGLELLEPHLAQAIAAAADEVIAGDHAEQFPLAVWQTGSGTQTNMNMNEVLANRASVLLGGEMGQNRLVHPNDHVNLGQSSNDVFPSAIHVAAVHGIETRLLPAIRALREQLQAKAEAFSSIIKIGRTHLQDAVPLTLGQEFSGYAAQMDKGMQRLDAVLPGLRELAIGGTAVGTGLNSHPMYGANVCEVLSSAMATGFVTSKNGFEPIAASDALVFAHGAFKTLAASLMKIANDVRWLASGPRCGIGEIRIPANEPGSSIMPGKVNPTQSEALTMLCCQVFGNDVAVNTGGSMGNFELNVFRPLMAHNFLQSLRLLADGADSFRAHCVAGIEADEDRIAQFMNQSLMLVTALAPHIGYDKAAEIAKTAYEQGTTLKAAALALGYVSEEQFTEWMRPETMLGIAGNAVDGAGHH